MPKEITHDLDALLAVLPSPITEQLRHREDSEELLEVVMDLGRPPVARFPGQEFEVSPSEVAEKDLEHVVTRIGAFGGDNRAGIERTLHRISAIRNRKGRIVGLTCRVGRAVFGTIRIIEDLVQSGKSILLLGRPGVGKTTMLREVARVLADDLHKRVVIVDTSNEIAGDGDIPHPAIGRARRMQVPTPTLQHAVMIEAVENHMPEVIVIDEIGTELEAVAARTIAERGVQLVATAHGNTLENLMMNPTLSDLIGGIQSVTLGDEEARRRGTQKSILERRAPPTFEIVVEIQTWDRVAVHYDVASVVDSLLRGRPIPAEVRGVDESGDIKTGKGEPLPSPLITASPTQMAEGQSRRIYPFGISRGRLEQAIRTAGLPLTVVNELDQADLVMTSKSHFRRKPQMVRAAEAKSIPLYVLRGNSVSQIEHALAGMCGQGVKDERLDVALQEAGEAIDKVLSGERAVELSPQNAYVRRLQHQLAERNHLASWSSGKEPQRRVRIFKAA